MGTIIVVFTAVLFAESKCETVALTEILIKTGEKEYFERGKADSVVILELEA